MDISIVWFRRDLRLNDNEAVARASANAGPCLYIFIIDPWFFKQSEIGWLRVKFLFESLAALDTALKKQGNQLIVLKGESVEAMTKLLKHLAAHKYRTKLYFNYDIQVTYGRERDEAIINYCHANNLSIALSHNYFLLHNEERMDDWWRDYYDYQYDEQFDMPKIPAWDKSLDDITAPLPQINPQTISDDLNMTLPNAAQVEFRGGEDAARLAIHSFLKDRVTGYRWKISRPYLAQHGATSLLGPHLAFGTISNRTVFQAAVRHCHKLEHIQPRKALDIATYLDRLRWRDSFTQRLWFHPELIWKNRFPEFDIIYNQDKMTSQKQDYFERWKHGDTGFPLLDAAMKQLKSDGYINFRIHPFPVVSATRVPLAEGSMRGT